MKPPHILLIVGGGIAAYKACELIRLIRKAGMSVRCVLTDGGAQFITPMTLAALSENEVFTTLWDLKNETEMGHIQLSREADLIVVCPATADLLAKMAAGISDSLATTVLLATDTPVLAVPAMNVRMWQHAATQRNVARLRSDGVTVVDPDDGAMACGEYGPGRLPEPVAIMERIEAAKTSKEIVKIWKDMAEGSFLNWYVNPQLPEDAVKDFEAIGQEEDGLKKQKRLLAALLDKNQLYVNLSEIDDPRFKVSDEDKALNKAFYGEAYNA